MHTNCKQVSTLSHCCIRRALGARPDGLASSSGRQDWSAGWDTNFFHGALGARHFRNTLTHFATPNTTCSFFYTLIVSMFLRKHIILFFDLYLSQYHFGYSPVQKTVEPSAFHGFVFFECFESQIRFGFKLISLSEPIASDSMATSSYFSWPF